MLMYTSHSFTYQYILYSFPFVLFQLLSGMLNKKLTSCQEVNNDLDLVSSLKCIDDELWCCHVTGIAVYSFDLKKLRKLRIHPDGHSVYSVASLDINTVVIATDDGLSTCSKQGM